MIPEKLFANMALQDFPLFKVECYTYISTTILKKHQCLEYASNMEMDVQEHVSSLKLYSMCVTI